MKQENNSNLYYLNGSSKAEAEHNFKEVIGWKVKGTNDKIIGTVDNLLLTKDTNEVAYLDIEVDKSIINANHKPYGRPVTFREEDFINKEDENHIIIPVDLTTINENLKNIYTNGMDEQTFSRTKRVSKGDPIDREYESIIRETYKNSDVIAEEASNPTETNQNQQNINGERQETDNEKYSKEVEGQARPNDRKPSADSGNEGVIGQIGEEGEIKSRPNNEDAPSPGEIPADTGEEDIEDQVDNNLNR